MTIMINIRFGIPVTHKMKKFKQQLADKGFFVEKITPSTPSGEEITAYTMTGFFRGEWQDLFTAWRQASLEAAIYEAKLVAKDQG